jgi:hypothetical protein
LIDEFARTARFIRLKAIAPRIESFNLDFDSLKRYWKTGVIRHMLNPQAGWTICR